MEIKARKYDTMKYKLTQMYNTGRDGVVVKHIRLKSIEEFCINNGLVLEAHGIMYSNETITPIVLREHDNVYTIITLYRAGCNKEVDASAVNYFGTNYQTFKNWYKENKFRLK